MTRENLPYHVSTVETIDGALWDHINDMNVHIVGNKGWKKMPVIWASAERSYQSRHNKDLRDSDGAIILPILTIERTAVEKSLKRKGGFYGNVPGNNDGKGDSITIGKVIKQDKTRNFENALSKYHNGQSNSPRPPKKTVYQYASIPMPVYLYITYSVVVRTQYQQQMNQALAPFWTKTGGINYFSISKDSHRFEAFIRDAFRQENNFSKMGTDERTIETKFDIDVLGYIIGADLNHDTPRVVARESIVDLKYTNERSIFGDLPQNISQADWQAFCKNLGGVPKKSFRVNEPGVGKMPDGPELINTCDLFPDEEDLF